MKEKSYRRVDIGGDIGEEGKKVLCVGRETMGGVPHRYTGAH